MLKQVVTAEANMPHTFTHDYYALHKYFMIMKCQQSFVDMHACVKYYE